MKNECLVGWEWIAQYIADVTNVYVSVAATPQCEAAAVQRVITEMAHLQKEGFRMNIEMVRGLLFKYMEDKLTVFDTPKAAKRMPLPKDEQVSQNELARQRQESELQKYSADLERYRLRERNIEFAGRLVAAAKPLEGWFRWVSSGPAEGTSRPGETTKGGANHFTSWLNGKAEEPDRNANMNCWEAVFFTAYKAGLANLLRLRLIHGQATVAARAKIGAGVGEAYYDSLTDSLGYRNSFPFVPNVGLCPSPGDIVFIDRHEHVTLCVEAGADIMVMSHWNKPTDGFHRYRIEQFSVSSIPRVVRFGAMPL